MSIDTMVNQIGDDDVDALFADLEASMEGMGDPTPQVVSEPQIATSQPQVNTPPQMQAQQPEVPVITAQAPPAPDFASMFSNGGFNTSGMVKQAEGKVDIAERNTVDITPPVTQAITPIDHEAQEAELEEAFSKSTVTPPAAAAKVAQPVVETVLQTPSTTTTSTPVEVPAQKTPEVARQTTTPVTPTPATSVNHKSSDAFGGRKSAFTGRLAITQESLIRFRPDVMAFQAETRISDASIDQCMTDQPSLMAYWSARHAEVEAQVGLAKRQLDTVESVLYQTYRKALITAGEKPTERLMDAYIKKDPAWEEAYDTHTLATQYANTLKGHVASLTHRRDMLIQRGSSLREELKGKVRILGGNQEATQPNYEVHDEMSMGAYQYAQNSINR